MGLHTNCLILRADLTNFVKNFICIPFVYFVPSIIPTLLILSTYYYIFASCFWFLTVLCILISFSFIYRAASFFPDWICMFRVRIKVLILIPIPIIFREIVSCRYFKLLKTLFNLWLLRTLDLLSPTKNKNVARRHLYVCILFNKRRAPKKVYSSSSRISSLQLYFLFTSQMQPAENFKNLSIKY